MAEIRVKVCMQPGAFLTVKKAFMICEISHNIAADADLNMVFDAVRGKVGFIDMIWSTAQFVGTSPHGFRAEFYEKDERAQILGPMEDGDRLTFWVVPLPKYEEEHAQTMKTSKIVFESVPMNVKEAYVLASMVRKDVCPISLEPFREGQEIALTSCWHLFDDKSLVEHFQGQRGRPPCPVCRQPVSCHDVLYMDPDM
jgi:hypothetical protein